MPTNFDYTPNDLVNPIGSNQLAAFALYYQRTLYERHIYPQDLPFPLELWYDKQLYGKVDRAQSTIITTGPNLSIIKSAESPNLYALAPVAMAFESFVEHMRKANIMGVAKDIGNPKMYDVKAQMAYSNPRQKYQAYLEGAFEVYRKTFTPEQNEKILGFSSFTDDYKKYLLRVSKTYPVTKSNFLLTPSVSPFTSGLAVAIDKGDCGDDNYKYVNYINDPNYSFYVRAAKKFGFLVDRNAPWILWADIFSEAFMINFQYFYLDGTGTMVTEDNFFQAFYTPTWKTDIENLRQAFFQSYQTLAHSKPYAEIFPPRHVGAGVDQFASNCVLEKINKFRPPATQASAAAILSDKFMIDFYVDLRHSEVQNPEVNPHEVKIYAYERYRNKLDSSLTNLENASEYINSVYSKYAYTFQNIATAFPASSVK